MKIKIETNAKCRNCIHWHFETEDYMDFLTDEETFCELDSKKRKESDECKSLEIDINTIKDNMKSAGFNRIKVTNEKAV